MQGLDFASPGGASPSQASQCTPVPVKIDARELGERLAADAWASADRLLMCLCLRAWRLQRHGRVAVKSPTPPVQFQGAKAPRPGRSWLSSTAFTPPRRLEEKEKSRAFDAAIGGRGQKDPLQRRNHGNVRLRDFFIGWKDEAHSSKLVKVKMEEILQKERQESREASPKSQVKGASPSRKVNVDLKELDPFSLHSSPKTSPKTSPKVAVSPREHLTTEQRLADAEQALAESLWLSQKGQRISRVEVQVERHLRTQELLYLRLTWQAWEDLVKESKRQAPEERQVAEARQGLQPMQSRRGNTVRQRGCASWEALGPLPGEKGKTPDNKVDLIDMEVPRGHGLEGWIRERSDLHMKIQLLRDQLDQERQDAVKSANNSQLALEALQEELQMEKEKLRTQGVLQRAYLQSEITSQETERLKAEKALEAVRKRSLARMIHPRILTKVFRAWARTFRQTVEAVSMLKQLPSVDSPRRLRFLIEDAERDSFSVQLDHWLEDSMDDPRSEQEQISDTRGLLKDQAKAAIANMSKVMEKADAMWAAVRLRISLFRGFSLTRCQAMENHALLFVVFASWARWPQQLRALRFAVGRSAKVSKPFELAEFFYLWQALQIQSAETDKVLSRTMRGSLALSSAGGGFSNSDLVKMTFHFWRLQSGFAYRSSGIIESFVPLQDSTWLSVVFFMWLVCVRASINEREETTERLRAEMTRDVTPERPESPANAPPQPHPAPLEPRSSIRASRMLEISIGDVTEEETAEQKEVRLVTEAVEKAGSTLTVSRASANTYKIGEKTVQVQLRNEQVLVKQGAAFVPMAKFLAAGSTASRTPASTPRVAPQGSTAGNGAVTPPGGRTPRSPTAATAVSTPPSPRGKQTPALPPSSLSPPKATPKATSKAASPKAKATASPKTKALSVPVPSPKAPKAAPVSPRSALAKALAPKAKPSGPSLATPIPKVPPRR